MELYYIIAITDHDRGEAMGSLYHAAGLHLILSMPARGTATSEHLAIYGLDATEKCVIAAVGSAQEADSLIKSAKRKLFIDIPGNGVMLTVPLKSVAGGKTLSYLTDDLKAGGAPNMNFEHELITVILNEGYSDFVMDAARAAGAGGGTVLQQRLGSTAELKSGVNGGGISLTGSPVSTLPSSVDSSLGSPGDVPVSSGGSIDAAYIVATPEQIGYIKPLIAMRNGSQSNVTLYASSRSAQGTSGPDFRLEMEGLQYSEIPMLAGSNPALMQQALSAVRNDYSLARLYAMGADAWSLANHFAQMRQSPGYELNGNTGDLTATPDCVINRKLSWLKYQQGQIVAAN